MPNNKQYIAYLLLVIFVVPSCCHKQRRHTRTEKTEEKPLNKLRPNVYYTAPPLVLPSFESQSGPELYVPSAQYPVFQMMVRRYPKIFLQILDKPNMAQYFTRAMELDQNVRMIVTTSTDGFKDYLDAMLGVYPDIEEGIKVTREESSSSEVSEETSRSRSRSASKS